jgi:hypothetical protein
MKKIVTMQIEVNDQFDNEPIDDCTIERCIGDVLEDSQGNAVDFYDVTVLNIEDID